MTSSYHSGRCLVNVIFLLKSLISTTNVSIHIDIAVDTSQLTNGRNQSHAIIFTSLRVAGALRRRGA